MPIDSHIYYHLSKKGSSSLIPIVLIHGAGGNHLFWPTEIRRLQGFRVYALDLPGHGKSEGHGLQDIHYYAEKILTWMQTIKLRRAVFVGHSMGGAVALTLALEYKEYVLGLILISTGARLRVHPTILLNTGDPQTFPTALSMIMSKSISKYANPRLVSLIQKRMEKIRPLVLCGDLIACDHFDVIDSLSLLKSPTLIICGQEDEMTPPRYSQYLHKNITGADIELIPKAGHMVMLEQPQGVMNAMEQFLLRVPYQPGQI